MIVTPVIPVWYGEHGVSSSDLYDPFGAVQLAWDLGQGWGCSFMLGYYTAVQGTISSSSNAVNPRFLLSYTANGWNLTTNNIFGIVDHPLTNYPHGSPCPTLPSKGCNTNFYNNDITATKTFGDWELGPVGYYSTDLNKPLPVTKSKANSGLASWSATTSVRRFCKLTSHASCIRRIMAVTILAGGRRSSSKFGSGKFLDPFATRAYLPKEIYKRMPGLALRASHSMTTCERPAADPANACCLAAAGQSGSALEPAERIGTRPRPSHATPADNPGAGAGARAATANSSATMGEAVEVAGAVEVAARLPLPAGSSRCPLGRPRRMRAWSHRML